MKIRLITLSEDRASGPDFIGQTGLSILVESDEANILFDTGQGMSASYNADALGIGLKIVDKIVFKSRPLRLYRWFTRGLVQDP